MAFDSCRNQVYFVHAHKKIHIHEKFHTPQPQSQRFVIVRAQHVGP